MTNEKNHEKLNQLDSIIWEKRHVDEKGRTVIPAKLRKYLGLQENSKILWIEARHKTGRDNEFLIEIGVDNKCK